MKILFFDLKPCVCLVLLCCSSCLIVNAPKTGSGSQKKSPYDQITFIDLVKKYVDKETSGQRSIEGIYSVSASAVKKGKGLFSSTEKEKTIDQKDNYAMVAIIKENTKSGRDYIEIPIDKDKLNAYPIRGELTAASDGNILVLKHFEPKGKILTYTLTYDQDKDILEGIRTETSSSGGTTWTYKVVFLKMYPKPSHK